MGLEGFGSMGTIPGKSSQEGLRPVDKNEAMPAGQAKAVLNFAKPHLDSLRHIAPFPYVKAEKLGKDLDRLGDHEPYLPEKSPEDFTLLQQLKRIKNVVDAKTTQAHLEGRVLSQSEIDTIIQQEADGLDAPSERPLPAYIMRRLRHKDSKLRDQYLASQNNTDDGVGIAQRMQDVARVGKNALNKLRELSPKNRSAEVQQSEVSPTQASKTFLTNTLRNIQAEFSAYMGDTRDIIKLTVSKVTRKNVERAVALSISAYALYEAVGVFLTTAGNVPIDSPTGQFFAVGGKVLSHLIQQGVTLIH